MNRYQAITLQEASFSHSDLREAREDFSPCSKIANKSHQT